MSSFALCSNDLERLFGELVEDVSRHADKKELLAFRCIVPSASVKMWLKVALCERGLNPLAAEILVLDEAFSRKIPSRGALLPLLISFLETSQKEERGQAFFKALGEEGFLSKERIFSFAKKYLIHFAQVAFFDEAEWFKKKGLESFGEAFSKILQKPKIQALQAPTFLFGFSSLHAGALTILLRTFNVKRLYLLSPSMLFWGDQCSDNEIRSLLKKSNSRTFEEAFMPYLLDRQKFLANSGRIGREFLNLLEDLDLPVKASYSIPELFFSESPYCDLLPNDGVEKKQGEPTLLDYLKADLLLLVGTREKPQEVKKDDSIEIHAAYTPVREVEALKEALSRYFGNISLKPASILVLATDLQQYRAAFEEVFGGKEKLYQIWGDSSVSSMLRLVFGFLFSQGGKKDVLKLVRHEEFLKSFGFALEDKEELIGFLERSGFSSWRESTRRRYLEKRGIPSTQHPQTFEQMYNQEVQMLFQEESLIKQPFLSFFAKIHAWLLRVEEASPLPLHEDELQPMRVWHELLKRLFEPFMQEDGSFYSVEKALLRLSGYAQEAHLPFSEAESLFFAEVEKGLLTQGGINAPIIVGKLGSFQPFPAEVVAILGAEEGSLPHEEENPLEYLEKLPPRLYPSSKLFEQYAFIEAILSAKRLFIGYQSYAFELREEVPYSPIVADLVAHLDTNLLIGGEKPSKTLFFKHSLYRKKASFNSQLCEEPIYGDKKATASVDFSEIQKAAKNPLSRYFSAQFGAIDEWEDETSIFIKNYEVKMHLEEAMLGKRTFSKREHALALQTYKEAHQEADKALKEMGIETLFCINVECVPTVKEKMYSGETLLLPCLECNGFKVQGNWKGLTRQGELLFSDTWTYELFQKWPEYIFRAYLAKKEDVLFEQAVIAVKERKIYQLPVKEPERVFASWVEFSQACYKHPFPFSQDIVKLLLKKPTVEELVVKMEKNGKIPLEKIAEYKSMWEEWACRLFSDLLLREEA